MSIELPKHYKETQISKPEAIGTGIANSAKTATNYIQADSTGIRIANANPSTATTYQHQTATNTEFVVDGVSRAEISGDGARFGKAYDPNANDNESHLELDYRSMQLVDKAGTAFFEAKDLRKRNGVYSVTETVTYEEPGEEGLAPAVIQQYDFPMRVTGFSVTLSDGTDDTENWTAYGITPSSTHTYITRDEGTVYGDVTFYGETDSSIAKIFTFGNRGDSNGVFGEGSVAMGKDVIATGTWSHAEGYATHAEGYASHAEGSSTYGIGSYSHAEGINSIASGKYAHAEGAGTVASGFFAHSEGEETTARGDHSHAQNWGTVAAYNSQTAIGRYNDNQQANVFEVGNGGSDYNPSNAFAVGWNGDLTYQGTLHGITWLAGTSGTTSGGVTTLPSSGTYILVTAHNSTPALNGIWIVRTGSNMAFKLAGGGNVTVTVSGVTLTVTTTAGTVNVYYQFCGT